MSQTLANLLPALTPGGTAQIKGTVTSAATSKPVEGIEVCAYTEVAFQCARTAANGEYDITGLDAGEYTVYFAVPFELNANYLTQYYKDKTNPAEATPVVLAPAGTATGINAALHEGGQITGKATDATTKAAVQGMEVCAEPRGEGEYFVRCAITNVAGEYDLAGLETNEYNVIFTAPYEGKLNYLRQYYNGKASVAEAEPVSVTAGATTPNINAALHEGGQIAGKITDAVSKAAVAGIQVCANGGPAGGACALTNESGEYDIGSLATGEYKVEFAAPYEANLNYLRQYYNDKTTYEQAEAVAVKVGSTTPNINAALQRGGQISGKVTAAASKAALGEIQVCASENGGEYYERCTTTNVSGEYTVSSLPTGVYTVVFSSFTGPYATQYYNNKVAFNEAQPVAATAGTLTPGINAAMQLGGEITGKVTDASTKAAVSGVEVCAVPVGSGFSTGCQTTDEHGEYALTKLAADDYRVEFIPQSQSAQTYLRQYYNSKANSGEANLVSVAAGTATSEINAALQQGAKISGTVTDASTKAPVGGIEVCASETGGEFFERCASTNTSGEYTAVGLPTGSYTVAFSSSGAYAPQYYNDKSLGAEATPIAVVVPATTANINAALLAAAEITGTVTDSVTKAPVSEIEVCGQEANSGTYVQCVNTNASGEYKLAPLAPGEYKVVFAPYTGANTNYAPQYYNGKTSFGEANVVTLVAGGSASSINAALHEAGKITGKVTDATTTLPIEGIEVCARGVFNEYLNKCGVTNASGEYAIKALGTAEYKVEFLGNGHNYLTQYYNAKETLEEASHVSVTTGETTAGINAAMHPGGKVTGTVTAAVGKGPIGSMDVCAVPKSGGIYTCAFTNASGEYSLIALPTAEYIIEFSGAGQNYITQYYNGKASYGEAEAVSVTAGATKSSINASLEVGGEITGTVTAAKTKEPIQNIQADVYTSTGSFIASAVTNANGEYKAVALPTGEYKVEFYSYLNEYRTQYYANKESLGEATLVMASAGGKVTPNINAALLIAPPVLISSPTISGSDQEGHKLNEAHGSWKNKPTEFTYKWLRCNKSGFECNAITGAEEQSYVPVFADVGHELRVEETAHNEGGASSPASSEPTEPIVIAPPENTKAPSITGTAQQGKKLADVAGTWTNEPTKAKYHWLRCSKAGGECNEISGATGETYVPVEEDVGHTLRVEETAENAAGPGSPATSAQTAVVVPPIPVNTALPTITGTAQQGKKLTEQHGGWEYSPTEYKLRWLACEKLGNGCLPIAGAEGETYVPGPLEVGGTIRVEEAATNAGGTSSYVSSAQTAEVLPAPPVNTAPPTITGTAQQGKTLTEHHGAWENNPTSYKVEWLRCNAEGEVCSTVSTSPEETYVPTASDVGHTIRVSESAKNAGGTSEKPALSNSTAVVVPPVPVLEALPTITGTAKQGDKLTLHHGKWSNTPTGYEDHWLRCNEAGKECEATGEIGEMYELTSKDVKHKLRVEEIPRNEGGPSAPATSEPTGVVVSSVPQLESPPTITGTAQQGQTLTAHHGGWSNEPEPNGYKDTWLRCSEAGEECEVTGATGETYVPIAKDVGHTIRVEEMAHNEGGTSLPARSNPTAGVLPAAPVDITLPTITGESVQGKTLTEHHGSWENTPTGYKLHWLQCDKLGNGCLPIAGAEGETYKPTALDIGSTIRVEEFASNAGGTSEKPAISEPTSVVTSAVPVNVSPPTIAGTAQKGQTLAEQHGSWTNEPTGYAYQWLRCNKEGNECSPISGAVNQAYLAVAADVAHTLRVEEVAINEGGASKSSTSGPSPVVEPIPLHAVAGEDLSTTAGVAVNFDGSGSTPASEIEKYHWEFGDGTEADGENVGHTYSTPGTYTAKLTISQGVENVSAAVTVTVAPAPTHTATVEVTDSSHAPLSGATVLYIGSSGERIQGATEGSGKASLAGLPEGTDTVYAYKSGFQPAVGHVAVSGGAGETSIALSSGEVVASTLKAHEMTLKEIEEAGINTSDPANQNVYEFEVRLAFPGSPNTELHCYINSHGEFVGPCGGGGGGGGGGGWGFGGPSCSPNECTGGGITATPEIVEGKPLIQWLVLRGKASVLKQFFEVTEVVQDLAPEPFKLAVGTATLDVPPGMSLAPTATPQSATQSVAAIPGGGSTETNWIVRGDKPGEYFLSANYQSKLEPFEAPVAIEARLASPLKVWGVEALSLKVQADEGFLAEGRPYHVHIGVTNKSNIPLYNVNVSIELNVHERFIFQPDQQAAEGISELKPGETIYAPEDILVPDAASAGAFDPEQSSAHFVGEEIHPGVGIEAVKPPPLYSISAPTDTATFVHLHWQAAPGAEGYEVFSTPTLDTAFAEGPNEVLTSPSSKTHVTKLSAGATDAYLPGNGTEDFYAVTSIIGGRATLNHTVIKGLEGHTGAPLGGPLSVKELGPGGNPSEFCLCFLSKLLSFVLPVDGPGGNFWHAFTDFAIAGRGLPLDLTRTYNSADAATNGPFGFGWTFPYGMHLAFPDATHVTVIQENGSQLTFEEGAGGTYKAAPRVTATLARSEGGWMLTRRHRATFSFNGTGELTQERDLNGYVTRLTYGGKGRLVRVTDPAGRKLRFKYTGGHIATATDPMGRIVHYEYDGAGDLTDVIDAAHADTHFTYDSAHRMLTMRTPNQAPGAPGSTGAVVSNTYDSQGRVIEQTDQLGRTTKFAYSGEPFAEAGGTTTITDPKGNITVQNYQFGELTSETRGYGTSSAATWTFAYDPATLGANSVTDPNGHTTTSTYDSEGNLRSDKDGLGHTTSYTYDALNDVLTTTDPLGVTTTMTYDAHGNKLTQSTPLTGSSKVQTTKNEYGDKKHPGDLTATTDAEGHIAHFVYDKYGNQISATDPLGNTTTNTYNLNGWHLSTVSPRGVASEPAKFTTTYAYNAMGQVTETVDPLGRKTANEYDPDQNLIAATDAEGKTTRYTYDAADQQIAVHRADGTTTQTKYNPDGSVKEEIDAAGHVTSYEYDPLARRISVTDTLGRTTHYAYDLVGNQASVTDPEGRVTSTVYNADNQPTSVTYSDGKTPNVTGITYDVDGQRTAESNGGESWAWSWDSLHRLTSVTEGGNGTVSYGYDLRNLTTKITYPHGLVVGRSYDADGHWTSMQDGRGHTTNFSYDANGNLTAQHLPGTTGVTDSSVYNNADELTELNDTAHAVPFFTAQYPRNTDGQISGDTSAPSTLTHFKYNALNQVCYAAGAATEECATPPTGATAYRYDAAGNLTQNGNTTQTYDAGDQLCWSIAPPTTSASCGSTPSGATRYTYDARGDRTAATPATGPASTYEYDQAGRLSHYAHGKATATYTYSGDGLRMSKTVGKKATTFAWDVAGGAPSMLEENKVAYVYGPDGRAIEQVTGSKFLWLHHDQLGSTRAVTDSTGAQVATYAYGPYGSLVSSTGSAKIPLRFAGQYEDAETGLYYMQARYYDPVTAQFMTRDPGSATSGSPYAYVYGDPLNFTDPLGLWGLPDLNPIDWGKAAVSGVSHAAGAVAGGVSHAAGWVGHQVHQVAVWASPVANVVQHIASGVSTVAAGIGAFCFAGAIVTSETVVGGITFAACAGAADAVSTVSSGVATVADVDLAIAGKPNDFVWDALGWITFGQGKLIEKLGQLGDKGKAINGLIHDVIGEGWNIAQHFADAQGYSTLSAEISSPYAAGCF